MAFDGSEGNVIEVSQAAEWTKIYRERNPGQLKARFFGRKILEQILAQDDCQGIRFYYGYHGGVPQLLAVGADSAENDQLGDGYLLADDSEPCPSRCSQPNLLNS